MGAICAYPWQQMIIDLTGEVVPCCYWSGYGNFGKPLGNTNTDTIDGIWSGPGYRELRRRMASQDLKDHPCGNCMAYRGANGSFPGFSWPTYFAPELGFCHLGRIPDSFLATIEGRDGEPVTLHEDGIALPLPDSKHDDIRRFGGGRYSLWNGWLYFSASDSSDPSLNGRIYELRCGDITLNLGGLAQGTLSGRNLLAAYDEYQHGIVDVNTKPSMISLISTADCNIDCRACSQNDVRLVNVQHRPQTVPDVLAHVPYLYQFIWHGGEPYLIRAFREFVDTFQTIDNPNLTFGFTSNGTMVTENEARKLRKFPGINASISIDSFNSDTFRKIRSGADFERVMENYLRLQATGDWPRRVLSVGMIVCKTNIGELGSNVSAAIHNDIGLNLSPVLLYPATEQLNVFEDFNSQTEGWEEALRRTAEVIAEAKSARRIAIGRIDPSGMVRELVSILAVQRANHAATKEIEITIEADEDFNTVMREPGIIAQVEDDPIPVAYVRLSRGAGNYVLRLPEGRVKGTQFVQIRLLHDLLEQGGVVGLGSVSIAGTPRVKLEVPPFKPVRRKRNIEMANYGVSSPSGLFLTSPSDVWNAYEQMTRVEQSAGHGVQTVYRSPDSKDWRTSQFGRLIGRWGSRLS